MYIRTQDERQIVDSRYVERFCQVVKPDAVLIIASYSENRAVTIGKYADKAEANDAFNDLFCALCSGDQSFDMPQSRLFCGDQGKKDARVKRKGGS